MTISETVEKQYEILYGEIFDRWQYETYKLENMNIESAEEKIHASIIQERISEMSHFLHRLAIRKKITMELIK